MAMVLMVTLLERVILQLHSYVHLPGLHGRLAWDWKGARQP